MNTKKIILIATITVVVSLAAWLVYGMFKTDEGIEQNQGEQNNEDIVNEEGEENNVPDGERGEIERNNDIYNEAVSSGDYNDCMSLDDEDMKNGCITKIAINTSSLDLCQEIEDAEELNYCKSRVYHEIAIENNNINNCSLIEDSFWHRACLNKIIVASAYDKDLCDEINDFGDSKECENTVLFQEAIETNNCDLLEGEIKTECEASLNINQDNEESDVEENSISDEEQLRNTDSDDDGLSDYDEINIHGTDPNNPDTDGDGYLDGVEVENGFDPLGA
jgi:hypothetical protein